MKKLSIIGLTLGLIMFTNQTEAYTEAYFPYNPKEGISGFSRYLSNQKQDTYTHYWGRRERAKIYITDLSHVTQRYGLMIWISDPNAKIAVVRLGNHERPRNVELEILEVTSSYKIVDVMDPTLEKIIIIVVCPNKNSIFSINIMAICE